MSIADDIKEAANPTRPNPVGRWLETLAKKDRELVTQAALSDEYSDRKLWIVAKKHGFVASEHAFRRWCCNQRENAEREASDG